MTPLLAGAPQAIIREFSQQRAQRGRYVSSAAAAAATAGRSVRFDSASSAYLSRTPASAGNRKTWTWSGWVKLGKLNASMPLFGSGTASSYLLCRMRPGDTIGFDQYGTGNNFFVETTAVYRDCSAWYHIVFAFDTTQGTDTNRVKLYVNGVQQTLYAGTNWPGPSVDLLVNSTNAHRIGADPSTLGAGNGDYYLALVHFIDGYAYDPSYFGETSATTGQWIAKDYSGSYGTNGFFLDFADNSSLTSGSNAGIGKDTSPNGNYWNSSGLSVTAGSGNDSLRDHPTSAGTSTGAGGEVSGNYCTWNPLCNATDATLSNGNLDVSYGTDSTRKGLQGTFGMSSGKWYWEVVVTAASAGSPVIVFIGISNSPDGAIVGSYTGSTANGWAYYGNTGQKVNNGSFETYGASYSVNNVIGIALDVDNGTLTFYKNGTSQGTAYSGLSTTATYFPSIGDGSAANTFSATANFGQRAFAHSAPSGFSPLVDTLLPTPTIGIGSTVMDVKLYTGNGTSQSITGLGFSPDLVWIKCRSAAQFHGLMDTVRGAGKRLISNDTYAEFDEPNVTAFNSDGFTLGSEGSVNTNSATYVGWTWDAGSSNATNNSGSITSTVRANISAGFSVVTYTAPSSGSATIGHSLGVAPQFILCKDRDDSNPWGIYHASLGVGKGLLFNTSAQQVSTAWWNNTNPTSTVFSVNTGIYATAQPNHNYVAYCWAPVAGYSAFGSYTGSTSQPFVYLGFRPKFVWIKFASGGASTTYTSWYMTDSVRDTTNPQSDSYPLWANASYAEGKRGNGTSAGSFLEIDFLSNGFRVLDTTSEPELNYAGATYIYCAWAEAPFPYARAR